MRGNHLAKKTILFTRPGGVSTRLNDAIVKTGARALHLPSMDIKPVVETEKSRELLADLMAFDILIFVSRNAVKFAIEIMPDIVSRARHKTILAIGGGTHEDLLKAGFAEIISTNSNTGSEALLAADQLKPEIVEGKKIMIIRGKGGRELLRDELLHRGAEVRYVELYYRVSPDIEPDTIIKMWLVEKPDAVVITSAEGLNNLLELTGKEERSLFLGTHLLVISERLKSIAESSGFNAVIKVATGYSDDDLMLALAELFEANENE